jgi:hypothetical protein
MASREELINLRISQAKDELAGVEFTEDQFSMLCMALDNIAHAIHVALNTPLEGADQ